MQLKKITVPSAVGFMSQHMHSPIQGDQKNFVRKATPVAAMDQVNSPNRVPVRLLMQQISNILQTCEKDMQPGQAIQIKIDGSDRVLFRTRSGDAVGLQTNEQYMNGSKEGYFFSNDQGDCTMKVDNRYLTTTTDPNYYGARILLHSIIQEIGGNRYNVHNLPI